MSRSDEVFWQTRQTGFGSRSWAIEVSKVHRRRVEQPWMTVCGRVVPSASKLMYGPTMGDEDCKRCWSE